MTEPFFLITGIKTDQLKPSVISKHFSGNRDSELAQDIVNSGLVWCDGFEGAAGERDSWVHPFIPFPL